MDLLLDVGVPPDRIVVSHCDERPEPELALEVARRGAYVEMDTWGMEMWATRWVFGREEIPAASDRDRLRMLVGVSEGEQRVLSMRIRSECSRPRPLLRSQPRLVETSDQAGLRDHSTMASSLVLEVSTSAPSSMTVTVSLTPTPAKPTWRAMARTWNVCPGLRVP